MKQSPVWLITGVSSGLGKELAKAVHQAGYVLIGTVRNEADQQTFDQTFPNQSQSFVLDLRNSQQVVSMIEAVRDRFGRIDALVNNAGYGLLGFVEEVNENELHQQFNINFVAAWKMIQQVLPLMRLQQSGLIIQISSRVGLVANAGGGIYAASKFALEGLSEALQQEVAPFGINVMLVEPGPLRTNFFGRSVVLAQHRVEDYYSVLADYRQISQQADGHQDGDPSKAARIILEATQLEQPPFRLPLSQATLDSMQAKITAYQQTVAAWSSQAASISIKRYASE